MVSAKYLNDLDLYSKNKQHTINSACHIQTTEIEGARSGLEILL